jgi:hypothetical protein
MDINAQSRTFQSNCVPVLIDYLKAPIFAACKQSTSRIVVIKKADRIYEIGGFNPFSNPESNTIYPAFDVRHIRIILTILSFRNDSLNKNKAKIQFSLKQFCMRYANSEHSKGGSNIKIVKKLLEDLANCWFRVIYKNREKKTYRILKDICIHFKPNRNKSEKDTMLQDEFWLDHVELHPEFEKLLSDYTELGQINLEVLSSITSPLAQCLYVYMPSRAIYRSEANPFPITLLSLLKEVGYNEETIPKQKSLRKKIFTQNKISVLHQMDGLSFVNGVLKVKLIETEDGSDYKLLFWNANAKLPNETKTKSNCPKLRAHWLESGRPIEAFNQKLKNNFSLENYQEELLERAQIRLEGNERFMQMALSLLGRNKFDEQVSEVKSMVLEPGGVSLKNPTKMFISQVCKTLATPIILN